MEDLTLSNINEDIAEAVITNNRVDLEALENSEEFADLDIGNALDLVVQLGMCELIGMEL